MAENRLESTDLVAAGILKPFRDEIELTETKIISLETKIKAFSEVAKNIQKGAASVTPENSKGIKDLDELQRRSNETLKNKLVIDKELQKENIILKQQQKELTAGLKEEIQQETRQLGTLEQLAKRNKELATRQKQVNLNTKAGRIELRQINSELNRNNKVIERNSSALQQQKIGVGRYSKALGGLRGALGKLGLAFGVFQLIRGSFDTIKEFEQGQADLASVLGVSTDGMKALTDQAKELGATTTFTATQVSELQKEFAKLGFSQSEIENVTKGTLLLAEATGTELARAAEVAGSTIRGFGLSTTETQRVVDTMAKAFSSSSLDMEKFANSISSVAPIAKIAGKTLEETTALLGTLTDRGIDASTAGTGLRNMFLDSQKAGLTLDEALAKVNNSSDKVGTSFDLFGKRGATLGVILAENGESVASLTTKLNENTIASQNGISAAEQMAKTQRETLGGSIELLKSAWDGYILKANEAGGVGDKLRKGFVFLADNIETILSVVKKLILFWGLYKGALIALKLQEKIKDQRAYNKSVKDGTGSVKTATQGVKDFGRALKAIAIVAFVSAIIELATHLWDVATGAEAFNRQLQTFQDWQNKNTKNTTRAVGAVQKQIDAEQKRLTLAVANREISEKQATIEFDRFINAEKYETAAQKAARAGADWTDANGNVIKSSRTIGEQIDDLIKKERKRIATAESSITSYVNAANGGAFVNRLLIADEKAKIELAKESIRSIKVFQKEIKGTQFESTVAAKTTEDFGDETEKAGKKQKKASTELANYIDLLAELNINLKAQADFTAAFEQIQRDQEIKELNDIIKLKIKENEIAIKKDGKGDTSSIEALINERSQLELDSIDARAKAEKEAAQDSNKERFAEMKAQAKEDRDELLAQDNITDAQRIEVKLQYKAELEKIRLIELDAEANLNQEILNADEQANNDKLAVIRDSENEILDLKKDAIDQLADYQEEVAEKEEKRRIERLEREKELLQALSDYAISLIDKKIEKIDEENAAAEEQADFLRELAADGNISAKESIAEEERLQAELTLEKEKQERKKQLILQGTAILQAYNTELQVEGTTSGQAFTRAITSYSALEAFLGTIAGFYDGTEDTGTTGAVRDEHGVITGYTHKNERVMTAKQNAKVGSFSNEFVAQKMEDIRLGKMVDSSQVSPGWENHLMVDQLMSVGNKLDTVNKSIQNIESNKVELGEITMATMKILETRTKGANKTINTFIIKR